MRAQWGRAGHCLGMLTMGAQGQFRLRPDHWGQKLQELSPGPAAAAAWAGPGGGHGDGDGPGPAAASAFPGSWALGGQDFAAFLRRGLEALAVLQTKCEKVNFPP